MMPKCLKFRWCSRQKTPNCAKNAVFLTVNFFVIFWTVFFHVSLNLGSQNGSQAKNNFNHFRLFSRHFSSFFAFKAFSAILVDFPCPGRPRTTKKHGKLNGKRWPKSFPRPPQGIQISSIWAGGGSGSAGSILRFYFAEKVFRFQARRKFLDVTSREAQRKFWDFTNEEDNKRKNMNAIKFRDFTSREARRKFLGFSWFFLFSHFFLLVPFSFSTDHYWLLLTTTENYWPLLNTTVQKRGEGVGVSDPFGSFQKKNE